MNAFAKKGYHFVALVLLSLAWQPAAFGRGPAARTGVTKPASPQTRQLALAATVRIAAPAPLMITNEIKCDPASNIYMIYTDAPQTVLNQRNGILKLPVRKLSISGGDAVSYAVPALPGYLDTVRNDFAVSGQGKVYALLAAVPGKGLGVGAPDYFVAKYNEDGTLDSYGKIGAVPEKKIEPLRLGAYANGNFLIAGIALEGGQTEPFAAVFDPSGNFIAELPVPPDITPVPYGQHGSPPTTAEIQALRQRAAEVAKSTRHPMPTPMALSYTRLASASDGNVYLLWGTLPQRLYVVSPDGKVLNQYEIPAPAAGLRALQLAPIGADQLFVQFFPITISVPSGGTDARKLVEVLDPSGGQIVASYQLAKGEDDRAMAACAISPNDFLYVRASDDRKNPVVLHYSPQN